MVILDLIFGLLLVLAGRNMFWLCVGIVGFLLGAQSAPLLGFTEGWTALALSLALGCLGVVLAVAFEWFMVIFGVGFLGGGYLLMHLFPSVSQDPYGWLIFVLGGITGMCLMVIFFDWMLIVISSLLGATLVSNAFQSAQNTQGALFWAIAMAGIIVQGMALRNTIDHDAPPKVHSPEAASRTDREVGV